MHNESEKIALKRQTMDIAAEHLIYKSPLFYVVFFFLICIACVLWQIEGIRTAYIAMVIQCPLYISIFIFIR